MMSSSKDLLSSQRNSEASLYPASQVSQDCSKTVQPPAMQAASSRPEGLVKQEESSAEEEKPRLVHLPFKSPDSQDSDSDLTDNSSGAF